MLVFQERREPEKKLLAGTKERTNNKLYPHMASRPGFEPGSHGGRQVLLPLLHPLF